MPDDVKILVFEAVRELLFNTVKHGQVSVARVSLQQVSGSEMHICVIDQGTGFDPAQPEERQEPAAGLGLFSIREHIALIGGRLRITSSPGAGSCFDLQNPLQPVPVVCDCLPDLDVLSARISKNARRFAQ